MALTETLYRPPSPFNPHKDVDINEIIYTRSGEIDERLQHIPLEELDKVDFSSLDNLPEREPQHDEDAVSDLGDIFPDQMDVSSNDVMDTSEDQPEEAPVQPEEAPVQPEEAPVQPDGPPVQPVSLPIQGSSSIFSAQIIPAFQQIHFNSSWIVTRADATQSERAFSLLGCIVNMAMYPGVVEGRIPVTDVFGDRPEIIAQIEQFVQDPKNGVTHDIESRCVVIPRKGLYALVKGDHIENADDKILKHFGHGTRELKNVDASIRKLFSGLKRQWDSNRVKGGTETYLNTFEYAHRSSKECYFKFIY